MSEPLRTKWFKRRLKSQIKWLFMRLSMKDCWWITNSKTSLNSDYSNKLLWSKKVTVLENWHSLRKKGNEKLLFSVLKILNLSFLQGRTTMRFLKSVKTTGQLNFHQLCKSTRHLSKSTFTIFDDYPFIYKNISLNETTQLSI